MSRLLALHGPCVSSSLIERLEAEGFSADAARQRLRRSTAKRLSGLVFPHNSRFFYLNSDYGKPKFWDALLRDIHIASPAYASAIASLQARGGIVPLRHFSTVCGAPIKQKGQISADAVLQRLKAVRLVTEQDVPGVGACVALYGEGYVVPNTDGLKARLITEKILLLAVKDWARKLGIASYEKIRLRDDDPSVMPPQVGTVAWDLTGPSYLQPLVRRGADNKPKPGFFVCDVFTGGVADEAAVQAFVRKNSMLSSLKRVGPRWSLLVADEFTREGFRLGRSHGLMLATPSTLFGREVATGLAKLLHTLSKAAAMAIHRPEVLDELMESLGRIEGAAANMRGALFELLVGNCVVTIDGGNIDLGKRVAGTKGNAEIDVFRVREGLEVWCYECKGYESSTRISLDEINHWLHNRIPAIHSAIAGETRFQNHSFHYEFWTTASFEPDALAALKAAAEGTKKYKIGWKDGVGVRNYAAKVKGSTTVKMLDKFYFKDPISLLSKKYDGETGLKEVNLDLELGDLLVGQSHVEQPKKLLSLPNQNK